MVFRPLFFKHNKIGQLFLLVLILLFTAQTLSGCSSRQTADNAVYSGESKTVTEADEEQLEAGGRGTATLVLSDIERKIIQNVDLTLKVDDVEAVMDKIILLTGQNGGYIVNSSIYKQEDSYRASLTVKVPQEKLTATVNTISDYGEVTNTDTYTEDVTEEYYDAQARLKVLEAKEVRLIALLDKAANIPDIVSIENELGDTRGEIEVIKGRLQYLTNSTSFSTININLSQTVSGQLKAPQGTTGKAWQGLITSVNNLINFGSDLIVFLASILPWLALLGIIYMVVRYIRNKRKDKTDDAQ